MIVETRYRDLPWEEIVDHFTDQARPTKPEWEENFRGRQVIIRLPGYSNDGPPPKLFKCQGPLFAVIHALRTGAVCQHIAEIGDGAGADLSRFL